MKKTLILLTASALLVAACEEKPIEIPEITLGKRKVIVEELTGVQCPNCPDGTEELVNIGETVGENLIVVSIHAADGYDEPYAESHYDFRTAEGEGLAAYIGQAEGFPTAAVNRLKTPQSTELYLPRTIWGGIINDELKIDPTVGIFMDQGFDEATRKLDIEVAMASDNPASLANESDLRLTVLITEDSIVDYQKVGLNKVPDYVHRHVLRDVLSATSGDPIDLASLQSGGAVTKTFSINLPADWHAHHCSVVAYVHRGGTPDKQVLQAEEIHVGN